jgi:tetratricopeptide (TPR) repeat protein
MGKQDQALNCLDETIRVYRLYENVMIESLVEVYEMKGDTLCEIKNHKIAISTYQECLHALDSQCNDDNSHACDERVAELNYKLGHAFAEIGEYVEAFDSYRESISIFGHVLGSSDLRVGEVMYDLGLLIISQGGDSVCARAMECFDEVIRIYSLKYKARDVKVADALVQKSNLLANTSEFDLAGSLLDEAIDIYRASLENDAVEIGKAMLIYGKLYVLQGNDDDAMVAFDEALRICLKCLGDHDVNVSLALSNIGMIHAKRLEYNDAVDKCKTALKIRVTRCEQDKNVADSVFNIGIILNDWGKEDEAYQYFQQALKLYIHLSGDDDKSVAKCQHKVGLICLNKKDFDQSLDSFLHALRICEQADDGENSMLASIYQGAGVCYYNKGENDLALENFVRCLRIQKNELGDDCLDMAPICDYIGLIYQKKERYEEAMSFHSKALLINENHFGKGTKKGAPSDFHIAKVLVASQKYAESIAHLHNHLKLFYDETNYCEEVGELYHLLGLAQSKLGNYEESISSLHKALDIRTKLFGNSNLRVAETRLDLAKVLDECGDSDQVSLSMT